MMTQLARFCLVGTIGFLTDAGGLWLAYHGLGLPPLLARIPSFAAAVLVTWWLNRAYTFRAPETGFLQSFPPYIAANILGLGLNIGLYSGLVSFLPFFATAPLLALAAGSIAALLFNFFSIRRFAFKGNHQAQP